MTVLDAHKKKNPKYWKPLDFFGFYTEERKLLTGETGNIWIDMNELTSILITLKGQTHGENKHAKMRNYISFALSQLVRHNRDIEFRSLFCGEDARKLKKNFLLKEEGSD